MVGRTPIDKVRRHCEEKGARGGTVTLKVKFADFELISRSRTGETTIGSRNELKNVFNRTLESALSDAEGRSITGRVDFEL
jgi:DNA polymerase-4